MGLVSFQGGALNESWADISVRLGLAFVSVVYIAGLLRAVRHGTTSYRVFRLSRDEAHVAFAYLLTFLGYSLGIYIVGSLSESLGIDRLIYGLAFLAAAYILLLRLVLLAPLIVLDNRNAFDALTESWHRTKGQTLKLVVAALVSVVPPLVILDGVLQLIFQLDNNAGPMTYAFAIATKNFFGFACLVLFAHAVHNTDKAWARLPEPEEGV